MRKYIEVSKDVKEEKGSKISPLKKLLTKLPVLLAQILSESN